MRAVILLALLGSAIAAPKSINRIVGGSPTSVENYPYIANMQYGLYGQWWSHVCGGSLVTNTAVLSAAHCYFGDSSLVWRVRLGTSFGSAGGWLHTVSRLVLYPHYNPSTLDNDVAVVRLSSPAIYSNRVQPARIAGENYNLPDATVVTALGWGALTSGGSHSEQLQHVDINIINHELCTNRYAYLKTLPGHQHWPDVTDNMLCAGILNVGGKDACQGDNGGPLVYSGDIVIGIISWGYQCADAFYPSVSTSVTKYSHWIVANA